MIIKDITIEKHKEGWFLVEFAVKNDKNKVIYIQQSFSDDILGATEFAESFFNFNLIKNLINKYKSNDR